ncbi:MAG TPA: hypothetical protein VGF94_10490 [Kofleriaceae bacterium]|jgi:hypothetical protein
MRRVVIAVVLAFGCGPVAYVQQMSSADDAIAEARAAHADKYSPYWWTRANEYIHMARLVAGHADYQGANKFGRLANEAAVKARDEAEVGAKDPSKLPYRELQPQPTLAPAKDTP